MVEFFDNFSGCDLGHQPWCWDAMCPRVQQGCLWSFLCTGEKMQDTLFCLCKYFMKIQFGQVTLLKFKSNPTLIISSCEEKTVLLAHFWTHATTSLLWKDHWTYSSHSEGGRINLLLGPRGRFTRLQGSYKLGQCWLQLLLQDGHVVTLTLDHMINLPPLGWTISFFSRLFRLSGTRSETNLAEFWVQMANGRQRLGLKGYTIWFVKFCNISSPENVLRFKVSFNLPWGLVHYSWRVLDQS